MVKLDLGAGKNKKEGFLGVDILDFEGVDVVTNLGNDPWPWEDNSVDEVHCSHMLEHLVAKQRIHFANELHRVLKPGCKAAIITPHFASVRAYGDLTHQWPPVVSFWYAYLNKEWRAVNAPHNLDYTCDFDHGYGFALHPTVAARNQEYQNYAVIHLVEGAQDLHVTLTKR
jgi:SAM-dependent methyltransferase